MCSSLAVNTQLACWFRKLSRNELCTAPAGGLSSQSDGVQRQHHNQQLCRQAYYQPRELLATVSPVNADRRGAADVQQFSTLSRLTRLDLGCAEGVAALAAQLPCLQSLALCLLHPPAKVSALLQGTEASMPFGHHPAHTCVVSCIAVPVSRHVHRSWRLAAHANCRRNVLGAMGLRIRLGVGTMHHQ